MEVGDVVKNNKKALFHNPVMETPWNFQGSSSFARASTPRQHVESPKLFCFKELLENRMDEYDNFALELKPKKNQVEKLDTRWTAAKYKSLQMKLNIERLTLNFPGLRKGQARAALQLSDDYERASLLVQIVTCYKQLHLPTAKLRGHQTQYISNMFVENVRAEATSLLQAPLPTPIASAPIFCNTLASSNDSSKSDDSGRVGVVISKKGNEYTSSLINEY